MNHGCVIMMTMTSISIDDPITEHFRLNNYQKQALERLDLETVRDLLYHFPTRYVTTTGAQYINELTEGDDALVFGQITNLETQKTYRSGIPLARGKLVDETGEIEIVWFHQPYIAKMLKNKSDVKISGKVSKHSGKLQITNPEYEVISKRPEKIGSNLFNQKADAETGSENAPESFSIPIYKESRGITSKWMHHAMKKLLRPAVLEQLKDPLPDSVKKQYNLPDIQTALFWIHTPKREHLAQSAQKRFAFEEIFLLELFNAKRRQALAEEPSYEIVATNERIEEFTGRFDFELTDAQKRAVDEIAEDMKTLPAMARLLEGDVGSGKTVVAGAASYLVAQTTPPGRKHGHLQTAYMAPTEILARQHFESFVEYFAHLPINIGFISGSGCKKFPSKIDPTIATDISKRQLLDWMKEGIISIVIGTHSLIQKSVEFKHLGLVIVDEQHRFGVNQRKSMTNKDGRLPHFLSMSATPIPRTLALTLYGDLDLSVLDELPAGRSPAKTRVVEETERENVYDDIRTRLQEGRQAYVICPRIHEPDPDEDTQMNLVSVEAMSEKLEKEFPNFTVGQLHGQMSTDKKDEVMQAFLDNEIQILVATSVVEVGVNVPNATTIIIEDAERFGLAQLHQLRGRVQRSSHDSFCYLFAEIKSETTAQRLEALEESADGFELAEKDLAIRGAGELIGTSQSGISDTAMKALKNPDLVKLARESAQKVLDESGISKTRAIQERLERFEKRVHFE